MHIRPAAETLRTCAGLEPLSLSLPLCRKFKMSCGTGHYKGLMAQFGTVVEVFLSLEETYQEVIADITRRMGEGMADFIEREVGGWE
jgi:hypothetical protein